MLSSLRQLGCDFAQGFHTGRPALPEECRRYLESGPAPAPAPVVLLPVSPADRETA